jgi:hypothetical protein
VEWGTPAYTDADVIALERRFQLGTHSYLGMNTTFPKDEFAIGTTTLGQLTKLKPEI